MAKDRTIAEAMMEDIASMVDSPFEYVMVLCEIGFGKVFSERKAAIRIWNEVHPEKKLPLPRKGGR